MECCGRTRRTRFCPNCGNEIIPDSPLQGLLLHVDATADNAEKRISEMEESAAKGELHQLRIERLSSLRASAKKWRQWSTELRELLKSKGI